MPRLREGRGGAADAIGQLLDEQVSVLVLADVGALDRETLAKVTQFVERGGLLVRFAGSRLAAGNDDLVPVRLRRGGRSLGGTLSWDTPRTLRRRSRVRARSSVSPIPDELGVRRQILAEPDGDLARKTWASLAGRHADRHRRQARRGLGGSLPRHRRHDLVEPAAHRPVRRHAAADDGAGRAPDRGRRRGAQRGGADARRRSATLDGFGVFVSPPATARAVPRDYAERATEEHPPGFYGPADAPLAVNALVPGDRLAPLDFAPLNARVAPLAGAETVDLRAPLLILALLLFLLDTLASLWLSGHLANARRAAAPRRRGRGGFHAGSGKRAPRRRTRRSVRCRRSPARTSRPRR